MIWLSTKLKEVQERAQLRICSSFLKNHEKEKFQRRIGHGDHLNAIERRVRPYEHDVFEKVDSANSLTYMFKFMRKNENFLKIMNLQQF